MGGGVSAHKFNIKIYVKSYAFNDLGGYFFGMLSVLNLFLF